MIEQIETQNFIDVFLSKISAMINWLNAYFIEFDSVRIISFVVLALAIIVFLLSFIAIGFRHIINVIKNNNSSGSIKNNKDDNNIENILGLDDEDELEKELQRELEFAASEQQRQEQELQQLAEKERIEKETKERIEKEQQEKEHIEKEKQKKAQEQKQKEEAEKKEREKKKKRQQEKELYAFDERKSYKDGSLEFDWKKGTKTENINDQLEDIEALSLSYKQSSVELNNLMGLAIDMLGRGVDELKIAQTLNFKNQGMSDENEILKAIDALKGFINLSIKGKFAKLKSYNELPNEDQALFHLANGDSSLALALLENLMDTSIDKANNSNSEEKRQKMYMEISEYACCFGALAEMNDIMLATSSYELAIELQSTNVIAWGRLGDVYKKANSMPKAVWAYQNVLNFADGEIDIMQIANANKNISEHMYAEGNSLQAAKLYNSSKQYYDSLGINRRLDKKEIEIIEVIEHNKEASLPDMINKLLSRDRTI